MSQNNDLYKFLNLRPECSASDIRTSFRRLAVMLHPDKNPNKDTKEDYDNIVLAYNVLSNAETRKEYDQLFYMQKSNKGYHELKNNYKKQSQNQPNYSIQEMHEKYPQLNIKLDDESIKKRYERYLNDREQIIHSDNRVVQPTPKKIYEVNTHVLNPESAKNSNSHLQSFKNIDNMYDDSDDIIEDKFSGINAQQDIEIVNDTIIDSTITLEQRIQDYKQFDYNNIKYETSQTITDDVLEY